jgi:type I restriction enzyme M protein
VASDGTTRWDCKYWNPEVRTKVAELLAAGGVSVRDLNGIETRRGRSPQAARYVDEPEGYAVVVKAGSCITRYGQVTLQGADWIEKQVFDDLPDEVQLQQGDVLLSSTGDGTLGKAAVWDLAHQTALSAYDRDAVDPRSQAPVSRGVGQ